MKLAKVSLAAVVALGTLSTASMAKDLSEAIKGVDVSGFLRYRFDNVDQSNRGYVDGDDKQTESQHEWKAVSNFTIPTSETFSAVIGLEYNDNTKVGGFSDSTLDSGMVINGEAGKQVDFNDGSIETIDGEQGFAVRQFYGVWNPNGTKTTVQLGKFNLGTPATSASVSRATGIMALNSDVENVTFAAAALDSFFANEVGNRENNVYALAALGGYGGFSGELWGLNIEDMVDSLIAAQLGYEYDMFGITGQYMQNNVKTVDPANVTTGTKHEGKGPILPNTLNDTYALWNVEGSIDWNILSATAGYMGSDTNGYFVQLDDDAAWINYAGEQWYGNFGTQGWSTKGGKNEIEAWWLTAMVDTTWNNVSVGADYV
ncbi:MAG: major outer membrane protein, partial [Campylobacterales bacterium]